MKEQLRVVLTEINSEGQREFRYYPVPNLETAKIVLFILLAELERVIEVNPNMYYLEVWDKEESG